MSGVHVGSQLMRRPIWTGDPAVLVPAVTPFTSCGEVDTDLYVRHCRSLLERGAHGLVPFGTNSETASLSSAERMAGLEALVKAGIDPSCLLPGTGSNSLPNAIRLTRHALELGCAGVLVMPPYFFAVSDDHLHAFHAALIDGVADERLRLYLYHFPQVSRAPITPSLIERLLASHPGIVAGLKDSAGVWEDTAAVLGQFPGLEVYSSSEALLGENIAAGGAGCISATANVNPHGIRRLINEHGQPGWAQALKEAGAIRAAFGTGMLVPALKAWLAHETGTPNWAMPRLPLLPLPKDEVKALVERMAGTNLQN